MSNRKSKPLVTTKSNPLAFNKKMKLLSKQDGKFIIEADAKYFMNQVQNLQQFFNDLSDVIGNQSEPAAALSVDSNNVEVKEIQVLEEQQSLSSQSEEKSKTPQQNIASNGVRDTQDFYRRIPHFFMGRFKKWAKILQENEVYDYLNKLKSHKKSKQGRYELGDFHKCFQIEKSDAMDVQKSKKKIKELFLEFLQNEAVLQIIQYNKITSQEQKTKYIDVIPNMVQEMYSDKPFHEFLAQANIEKAIQKKKQFQPQLELQKTEDIPKPELFRGESFKYGDNQ